MKKSDRLIVFNMFDGKCAYCGCDLLKGWHVDHFEPVWRNSRYLTDAEGRRIWCPIKHEYKTESFLDRPQNDVISNFMPSCASCNILKGGGDLEGFRKQIKNFINSLNLYHNQYKFAKRYGLVIETDNPVIFYFEQYEKKPD